MSMTVVLQIAAVGFLVAMLQLVLKQIGREEHGLLVALAGILVVLFRVMPYIVDLLNEVQAVFPV